MHNPPNKQQYQLQIKKPCKASSLSTQNLQHWYVSKQYFCFCFELEFHKIMVWWNSYSIMSHCIINPLNATVEPIRQATWIMTSPNKTCSNYLSSRIYMSFELCMECTHSQLSKYIIFSHFIYLKTKRPRIKNVIVKYFGTQSQITAIVDFRHITSSGTQSNIFFIMKYFSMIWTIIFVLLWRENIEASHFLKINNFRWN